MEYDFEHEFGRSVDDIDTDRMPAARAARLCRRLAANPATQLGAEVQGLSHPFSWADFAIADLQVAASRGIAEPHWSRPNIAAVASGPVDQAEARERAERWKSRIRSE